MAEVDPDWRPHDPQCVIAAEILVGDQRPVGGAAGETLRAHAPHGVIVKNGCVLRSPERTKTPLRG